MIETTAAYKAAIKGDVRRVVVSVTMDLVDPDIVYGQITGTAQSDISQPAQLHDKAFDLGPSYITLEHNRWILDGSMQLPPSSVLGVETGFETEDILSGSARAEMSFSGVDVLQACSVIFTDRVMDGRATSATVEILQGASTAYSKTITGITGSRIDISGFTVYAPTGIRVTVTGWSLSDRMVRIAEIIPGIIETMDGSALAALSITQQTDFSLLTLPYGTCSLTIDNSDRRFDWRSKNGAFKSLEERQDVVIKLGVRTEGGDILIPAGVYFLNSGGWRSSDNGLGLKWSLVDILGLIQRRKYEPPDTLPTTFGDWITSIVSQLGPAFTDRASVHADYADLPFTLSDDNVADITCGSLLLWLCQAAGAWPCADPVTGSLSVQPLPASGISLELTQLAAYPTIAANKDIAALVFYMPDNEQVVISGTNSSSPDTRTISNPLIDTEEKAIAAARGIISGFGGSKIETTGRGDPSSQLGDVATVWLDGSQSVVGRVMKQTFSFMSGVLQGCKTTLLAASGISLYENSKIFTASGSFTVPAGVTELRVILVGKGENGTDGTDGTLYAAGVAGVDGAGGRIWTGLISVSPGQMLTVTIGQNTTLGAATSANGVIYPSGFRDINSGRCYGRTGVPSPAAGSGDGGAGGEAGKKGSSHSSDGYYIVYDTVVDEQGNITLVPRKVPTTITVVDVQPTNGGAGAVGATGSAVIYWERQNEN